MISQEHIILHILRVKEELELRPNNGGLETALSVLDHMIQEMEQEEEIESLIKDQENNNWSW